jgi:hypothetical protein
LALSQQRALNLGVQLPDTSKRRSFADNHEPVSAAVPKSGLSSTPAENPDAAEVVSIALFSCSGLLISLIVVILRIHGVF